MFSSSLVSLRKWTPGAIRNIRKIRDQQKQAEIRRRENRKAGPVSIYLKEIVQVVKEEEQPKQN